MKMDDILKATGSRGAAAFLKVAPSDELYTIQELSEKLSLSESTIKSSRFLKPYLVRCNGRSYYGSPAAIEEAVNRLREKEDNETVYAVYPERR